MQRLSTSAVMKVMKQFLYFSPGGMTNKVKASIFLGDSSKYLVLPLHGSMLIINRREIFDHLLNKRKIVPTTNVAESSITMDYVVYVVDSGKAEETSDDALNELACLLPSWISREENSLGMCDLEFVLRLYLEVIRGAF